MSSERDGASTHGVCHFFKLSGELRNRVYEFALTEDSPLRLIRNVNEHGSAKWYKCELDRPALLDITHPTGALSDALLEANQLRYVNKQLYVETRGLELQYNDLGFRNIKDLGYFLQHCTPVYLGYLRVLVYGESSIATLAEAAEKPSIFHFCEEYPKALIKAHLANRMPHNLATLLGLAFDENRTRGTWTLMKAIFSEDSEQLERFTSDSIRNSPLIMQKGWEDGPVVPLNFRFFPGTDVFNERAAIDIYGFDSIVQTRRVPYIAGGPNQWGSLMEPLMEHGI